MPGLLENTGRWLTTGMQSAGYTTRLYFEQTGHLRSFFSKFPEIVRQMYVTGVQSMGVTFIVALFVGMVLALQSGLTLRTFGIQALVAEIVGITMTREMGPLMTAIILAGRVGSSMAAEIGTMSVSEELDALEIMSINPVKFLVMPRVLALTIMAPVLTIFADIIGILGGMAISSAQLSVDSVMFFNNCLEIIQYRDLFSGLMKAMVFGALISIISCAEGLRTRGGAEGVGNATRRAVVNSLLAILISNYVMTMIVQRMFYPI